MIIIDKANGGYASAINAGLDIASGEFVQIVESDDFCDIKMCEEMYNKIKDSDADYVTADFYTLKPTLFGDKLQRFKYFKNKIDNFTLKNNPEIVSKPSYPWKNLYRTSFLKENNIRMSQDGIGAYEDLPWNATIMANAKKILYLQKPFYKYRLFAEGSSTSCGKRSMINYIKRRAQIKEIFIKYGVFDSVLKEHYWAGALNGCLFFLKKIGNDYKEEFYNEMKKFLLEAKDDEITFKQFNKKMKFRYNSIMNNNFKGYLKTQTAVRKLIGLFEKG